MSNLETEGTRLAGALQAALAITDPKERYDALTEVQPQLDKLVSAVKVARGVALDELYEGRSYQQVADLVGFRRYQHVQDLINAARAAQREEKQ